MKLWDKGTTLATEIEEFTVGNDREMDLYLAEYDVLGSMAHTRMLNTIGLLTDDELTAVQAELKTIYHQIKTGSFAIEPDVEDVHSQVELMLTRKLGSTGKKIHSGRSRNDQVLVDLKLFTRTKLSELVQLTVTLFNSLLTQSEKNKDVLMPGYTHMQVAMPSSFGLWFGAYAESLTDDMLMLLAAYRIANQNPLGSAAGYGSSFPLNRTLTTTLLGFDDLNYNVVYAQMGRGKMEKIVAMALSSLAGTLAKMAADICLYNSQNFAFLRLPDELTTGSSIMPHKKNPDVFELLRAKCNKIQALPFEISHITSNLTSGYFRDMQMIKESFLPVFDTIRNCLNIAIFAIEQLQVNTSILNDDKYNYLFTVEDVNSQVLNGEPFRDAYKKIGLQVEAGEYQPNKILKHTHEGSIGNLCNDKIKSKLEKILNDFNFATPKKAIESLLNS